MVKTIIIAPFGYAIPITYEVESAARFLCELLALQDRMQRASDMSIALKHEEIMNIHKKQDESLLMSGPPERLSLPVKGEYCISAVAPGVAEAR